VTSSAAAPASVTFAEVTKLFDGVAAVKELSLEVGDGEFMVLVGPSGCGKTTALRMVAGLEEITAGEILIGDRVVNDVDPRGRDVAMVFQNYALYPHMTVFENIAFGLRARGAPKAEIRSHVERVGKALGLGELLQRKPRQLSGGQRQRVAMGRAIVRDPRVFLMDEPLSNLDARLRVQMRAEVARVQRDLGVTTIYVTHDQVEAMTMGDRVAVMSQGVLQQVDTPQRLYDHPANLFVAGFIGTPPMNLLEGDAVADDGGFAVTIAGQPVRLSEKALSRYPDVRRYVGKRIVFGVRSDDLHRAASRDDLPSISARLELVEALGSTSMAYFRIDTRAVTAGAGGVEDAVEEEGTGEGITAARPNLVASFSARDAADLKPGEHVPVAVDTSQAHLFDAETGAPLR
jgi:multiple sugar transport system ATP-binding protein